MRQRSGRAQNKMRESGTVRGVIYANGGRASMLTTPIGARVRDARQTGKLAAVSASAWPPQGRPPMLT